MGIPQTPSPPHLYPQALQLKLYQAFIFSIPILFSIILSLLFYLFYLKRRASSLTSPPQTLPITTSNQAAAPNFSSVCQISLKDEVKDKLPIVLFDEELRTRDSQCCVCLGEYEMKEEVLQIPSCKHVFHIECIHNWLHSNSTCPLCRSLIIIPSSSKPYDNNNPDLQQFSGPLPLLHQDNGSSYLELHPQHVSSEQHPQQHQDDVAAASI